jgi:phage shock protein PspC (stress-responsive transcriptional regulator)
MEPMNDNDPTNRSAAGISSEFAGKLNELGGKLRYLRRSRNDRVFGGIAGGIAEVFGVETVVVRIAIVVLSVMSGVGFLAYVIAWALIAKAPELQSFDPSFASAGSGNHRGQSSSPHTPGNGSGHSFQHRHSFAV